MSFDTFGENMRWFIARVVDTKDDKMMGRVKIRILNDQTGDYEKSIPDEHLLWAYPISAIQSASLYYQKVRESGDYKKCPDWINAVGLSPTGISNWSYVFGFYIDGIEQNIPVIFGTYHKLSRYPEPENNSVGSGEYNDVAALAREKNSLSEEKKPYIEGSLITEPESAYDSEYPYNTTYTTKSGHAIELDDTEGHERIHIWHKSGSYEEINENGRRVIKSKDDDYEVITGDKNILVAKKKGSKGNMKLEIQGNWDVLVKGNCTINIEGMTTINSKGPLNISSDTMIQMTAPIINLN